MIAVTMKDALVHEILDEDYHEAIDQLNIAGSQGKMFIGMDDPNGTHVMINISNIMVIKEIDEVAELS